MVVNMIVVIELIYIYGNVTLLKLNYYYGGYDGLDNNISFTSSTNLNWNEWYHVVVMFDNDSKKFKLYINNVLDMNENINVVPINISRRVYLGRANQSNPPDRAFDGVIKSFNVIGITFRLHFQKELLILYMIKVEIGTYIIIHHLYLLVITKDLR